MSRTKPNNNNSESFIYSETSSLSSSDDLQIHDVHHNTTTTVVIDDDDDGDAPYNNDLDEATDSDQDEANSSHLRQQINNLVPMASRNKSKESEQNRIQMLNSHHEGIASSSTTTHHHHHRHGHYFHNFVSLEQCLQYYLTTRVMTMMNEKKSCRESQILANRRKSKSFMRMSSRPSTTTDVKSWPNEIVLENILELFLDELHENGDDGDGDDDVDGDSDNDGRFMSSQYTETSLDEFDTSALGRPVMTDDEDGDGDDDDDTDYGNDDNNDDERGARSDRKKMIGGNDGDEHDSVERLFSYHFVKHEGTPYLVELIYKCLMEHGSDDEGDDRSRYHNGGNDRRNQSSVPLNEMLVASMTVLNMLSHEYEEALEYLLRFDSLSRLLLRHVLKRAFESRHIALLSRVFQVLTIICHTAYDQRGFWLALDVISHVSKSENRFQILMKLLLCMSEGEQDESSYFNNANADDEDFDEEEEDHFVSLQIAILSLINTLINKPDDIHLKRYLADEMFECGLWETIERLRSVESLSGHVEFVEEQIEKVDKQEIMDEGSTDNIHAFFNQMIVQLPNANSYLFMHSIFNHVMNALRSFDRREHHLSLVSSVLGQCVNMKGDVIDVLKMNDVNKKMKAYVVEEKANPVPNPAIIQSHAQSSLDQIVRMINEGNPELTREDKTNPSDPVRLVQALLDKHTNASESHRAKEKVLKATTIGVAGVASAILACVAYRHYST